MKWDTPEFKQLQETWYQRLADDGFVDAESAVPNARFNEDDFILKKHSANAYQGAADIPREAKSEYYQRMAQCVAEHEFPPGVDRIVLQMHTRGSTLCSIATALRTLGLKPSHRETLRQIIRHYEHLWGVRYWDEPARNRYLQRKKLK